MAPAVNAEPKLECASPRQRKTLKIWVTERPIAWLLTGWLIGLSEDKLTDSFSFDICSDELFSEPVNKPIQMYFQGCWASVVIIQYARDSETALKSLSPLI